MTALAVALLAVMLRASPPDVVATDEGIAAASARYEAIASAIASVVEDPAEDPIAGTRAETGLLLLALARHESGFLRLVDIGERRSSAGACGLFQALPRGGRTVEGWTCAEIVRDRAKAARSALHLARSSWRLCGRRDEGRGLAAYASGSCKRGLKESRAVVATWRAWKASTAR